MKLRTSRVAFVSLLLACLGGAVGPAFAQSTGGTINGTITDDTGAALPGVSIGIKRVETGTLRNLVTDPRGKYTAPSLEPGSYEVTAELQGFNTAVRKDLRLTLGSELTVNLQLGIGALQEEVVVTGEAQLVETTRSTVANFVDEKQIRELPLNGRDFSELALQGVGVVQTPTVDRSLLRGMGTQFSVGGARPNQVSYLLDGTDIADQGGQSPGSAAGGMLGVETVREFQVITNNYSAEYGRSAGGIVSAITRSGTNTFQGGAFEFMRDEALDTRTFFDDPSAPKPPLSRHQYGFNLGGPIRRDRTFFFGAFEGLRQDKSTTIRARVPSTATRNRADLSPAVKPYMLLYPAPNAGESGASGIYSTQVTEPSREIYIVNKVDHTFSDENSVAVRYTFDNASNDQPQAIPTFSTRYHNRNQYVTGEWKHVFGSSALNDFRAAFNRTVQVSANVDNITVDPSLYFIAGAPQLGSLNVSGLEVFGPDTSIPSWLRYNVVQVMNSLSVTRGSHSIKTGGSWTHWINDQDAQFQPGGRYTFTSIDSFVQGRPSQYESALQGTTSERGWRQSLFGFYAQDDWAVRSNLTLNLGVRYELITTPREVEDRVASFRDPLNNPEPVVGYPLFRNPSLKNVSPRVGFAWDVRGDGKTAVRGGAGQFYEPILANYYRTFGNRTPPFFAQANLTNPPFPHAVAGALPTSQQRLDLLQWDLKNPYMLQYNLTVQHELLPQFSVMAGYIGSRGINLFRNVELNQAVPVVQPDGSYFFPTTNRRRSPLWNSVRMRVTDGNSWYNGLVASATKRFSSGLQFQGSYTLGRSYDEGSISAGSQDFNNGFQPRYAYDRHDNYGLSDFDVRHNFTFNYSWSLPFGENAAGAARVLVAGWQLSGIVTLRAGVPFTPLLGFDRARARPRAGGDGQRPSWAPGYDASKATLGGPERYFDPNAFVLPAAGTFGDVPRNALIGPGYAVWNSALFKNIELGGRRKLQFRVETFNILNRANFGLPAATVFGSSGRVENAGEITDIVGTARQIQLGVKIEF